VFLATYSGSLRDLKASPPNVGAQITTGDMLKLHPDPGIVFGLWPNIDVYFNGTVAVPLPLSRITTNSLGWRGPEFPPITKPTDQCRIVAVGDSFLWGWGVEESERYTTLLEVHLNEVAPQCRWRILTFAVPGYNTVQEANVFRRYGAAYSPDIVIYHYVGNDHCLPNFLYPPPDLYSTQSFILRYLDRLLARSELPDDRLRLTARNKAGKLYFQMCKNDDFPPEYRHFGGQENQKRALEMLANDSAAIHAPLVITSHHGIDPEWCKIPNVHCISLMPQFNNWLASAGFASFGESPLVHNVKDTHYSAQGHRLYFELFAQRLMTELQLHEKR
jgi:hypothetical protein